MARGKGAHVYYEKGIYTSKEEGFKFPFASSLSNQSTHGKGVLQYDKPSAATCNFN